MSRTSQTDVLLILRIHHVLILETIKVPKEEGVEFEICRRERTKEGGDDVEYCREIRMMVIGRYWGHGVATTMMTFKSEGGRGEVTVEEGWRGEGTNASGRRSPGRGEGAGLEEGRGGGEKERGSK